MALCPAPSPTSPTSPPSPGSRLQGECHRGRVPDWIGPKIPAPSIRGRSLGRCRLSPPIRAKHRFPLSRPRGRQSCPSEKQRNSRDSAPPAAARRPTAAAHPQAPASPRRREQPKVWFRWRPGTADVRCCCASGTGRPTVRSLISPVSTSRAWILGTLPTPKTVYTALPPEGKRLSPPEASEK